MNKTLKSALLVLSGAAIGSICTWLAIKGYYKKKSSELVEAIRQAHLDMDDMQEDLTRAKEAANEYGKMMMELQYGPDLSTPPSPVRTIEEDVAYANAAKTAIQYHKMAQQRPITPLPDEDDLPPQFDIPGTPFKHAWELPKEVDPYYNPAEDLHPEDTDEEQPLAIVQVPDHDPPPYLITADEYLYDLNHSDCLYQQDCLTYYMGDDVLADDEETVLDHELVGEENLQVLKDGDDVIFVRNVECGMEWEIQKAESAWVDFFKEEHTE